MSALTSPWHPVSIRPVRTGWYEIRFFIARERRFAAPVRRWWNGRMWRLDDRAGGLGICVMPADSWRGLADDPRRGAA